jgi:site-specific DNA recombinase
MIKAGTSKPAPFDIVIVHSFSRFFRDHFELEFYVRKLAKNAVKLVSITQEMGDDPMHVMMRQIMALFDEYQSKENAKHVLRDSGLELPSSRAEKLRSHFSSKLNVKPQ